MENKKRLTLDTVLDWVLVLSISGLIMLVGNYVGFGVDILESIPGMAILVAISVVLTVFAGLIPSRGAARKDPVEALRSE